MQRHFISLLALCGLLSACSYRQKADLIVKNALIYTVDSAFSTAQAFAVKDGKFLKIGTTDAITAAYEADSVVDAKGQPVYPGFYDPHSHFMGLGQVLSQADLVGAASFNEVIARLKTFRQNKPKSGWGAGYRGAAGIRTTGPVSSFQPKKN